MTVRPVSVSVKTMSVNVPPTSTPSSFIDSLLRSVILCPGPLSLLEAQLGEHGESIGVIDMALDVVPNGAGIKLQKERNQSALSIDNFLKPPQFGIALR